MQQEQEQPKVFVAFAGVERVARGSLAEVAPAAKRAHDRSDDSGRVVVFDEETGQVLDMDLSGSEADVLVRLKPLLDAEAPADPNARRGPGRPRLGVVSREVSLLPRHWSWLELQRGGASAALRRLVDSARKANTAEDTARQAVDAAHRFMWDMAGDRPGFEEASRALYAQDFTGLHQRIAHWPTDIRDQVKRFTERARVSNAPDDSAPPDR